MPTKFLSRKVLIGIASAVVLIVGWAAFRPELLLVNKKANDAFPTLSAASDRGGGDRLARDARNGNVTVPVATGRFHGVAHQTQGNAGIFRLPDGRNVLRLTHFQTSNGPDVRLYLIGASDATDNAAVTRDFVEIAKLKANTGDQNYSLPASLDIGRYHAVTVWCYRFNVNFGTAPLTPSHN